MNDENKIIREIDFVRTAPPQKIDVSTKEEKPEDIDIKEKEKSDEDEEVDEGYYKKVGNKFFLPSGKVMPQLKRPDKPDFNLDDVFAANPDIKPATIKHLFTKIHRIKHGEPIDKKETPPEDYNIEEATIQGDPNAPGNRKHMAYKGARWLVKLKEMVNKKALARGTKVEREHTKDDKIPTAIATTHLEEDPKYYEKLAKMEKGVKTESTDPNDTLRLRKSVEPMRVRIPKNPLLPRPGGGYTVPDFPLKATEKSYYDYPVLDKPVGEKGEEEAKAEREKERAESDAEIRRLGVPKTDIPKIAKKQSEGEKEKEEKEKESQQQSKMALPFYKAKARKTLKQINKIKTREPGEKIYSPAELANMLKKTKEAEKEPTTEGMECTSIGSRPEASEGSVVDPYKKYNADMKALEASEVDVAEDQESMDSRPNDNPLTLETHTIEKGDEIQQRKENFLDDLIEAVIRII